MAPATICDETGGELRPRRNLGAEGANPNLLRRWDVLTRALYPAKIMFRHFCGISVAIALTGCGHSFREWWNEDLREHRADRWWWEERGEARIPGRAPLRGRDVDLFGDYDQEISAEDLPPPLTSPNHSFRPPPLSPPAVRKPARADRAATGGPERAAIPESAAPSAPLPAPPRPIVPPVLSIAGMSEDDVRRALGAPVNEIGQGAQKVWRYAGQGCRVDVIFFRDVRTSAYAALAYKVFGADGVTAFREPCLQTTS